MIEFNVVVPKELRKEISEMNGNGLHIISSSHMNNGLHYFQIESSEEDMLMFTLRFGQENVWKR